MDFPRLGSLLVARKNLWSALGEWPPDCAVAILVYKWLMHFLRRSGSGWLMDIYGESATVFFDLDESVENMLPSELFVCSYTIVVGKFRHNLMTSLVLIQ